MALIGILDNREIYNITKSIFTNHFISYDEIDPQEIINNNSIEIVDKGKRKISLLLIDKNYLSSFSSLYFDALLVSDNTLDFKDLEYDILIKEYDLKSTSKKNVISYGFNDNSNITYSSIMEKNNLNYLFVCIQNTFKTFYNTKMIKFEFSITTNTFNNQTLNSLLGAISLSLYFDVKFLKNDFINTFEGEIIYV